MLTGSTTRSPIDYTSIKTSLLISSSPILTKGELFRPRIYFTSYRMSKLRRKLNKLHYSVFLPHITTFSHHVRSLSSAFLLLFSIFLTIPSSPYPLRFPLSFLQFLPSTVLQLISEMNFVSRFYDFQSFVISQVFSLRCPVFPACRSHQHNIHCPSNNVPLPKLISVNFI